jgi:hypothetical protein
MTRWRKSTGRSTSGRSLLRLFKRYGIDFGLFGFQENVRKGEEMVKIWVLYHFTPDENIEF